MILNRATLVAVAVLSSIFVAFAFNDLTEEFKRFMFAQYASLCVLVVALRIWWIYNCDKSDSSCTVATRIVVSTFVQLVSLASSLLTLVLMQVMKETKGQSVGFFTFFLSYVVMVGALMLNIGNCMKLVFLIIVFVRRGDGEVDSQVRSVLSSSPEAEMLRNIFRDQGLQILIRYGSL